MVPWKQIPGAFVQGLSIVLHDLGTPGLNTVRSHTEAGCNVGTTPGTGPMVLGASSPQDDPKPPKSAQHEKPGGCVCGLTELPYNNINNHSHIVYTCIHIMYAPVYYTFFVKHCCLTSRTCLSMVFVLAHERHLTCHMGQLGPENRWICSTLHCVSVGTILILGKTKHIIS